MIRHASAVLALLCLPALAGCAVRPGSTAGNTWGGVYSARNQPKPEAKKEEKKSDVKAPPMNVEPGPYDRTGSNPAKLAVTRHRAHAPPLHGRSAYGGRHAA